MAKNKGDRLRKKVNDRVRRSMLKAGASFFQQLLKIQHRLSHPLPPIERPVVVEPIVEPRQHSASVEYPSHSLPRPKRRKRPMSGEPKADTPTWDKSRNAGLLVQTGKVAESSFRWLVIHALTIYDRLTARDKGGE